MSKAVAPKKAGKEGQYTWRVRRKQQAGDTPWKQGGPAEIMEVVFKRLEILESFEKSTKEIERRINNLDKNILAVAKTIMPRPPGAPPAPVVEPVLLTAEDAKTEAKKDDAEPEAAAPSAAAAAASKPGIKHVDLNREKCQTLGTLLGEVQAPKFAVLPQKVSVIGAGPVGVNLAFAILNQGVASEIALVDADEKKLKAEAMDMQYGMGFVKNSKVAASTDVGITANSRLVVLTVGQGSAGEAPATLAQKNIDAFKVVIPKILEKSPNCLLLVVSNPVDVMTYAAWKISGLPPHRVIGSGTNLDSNRFRALLADKLKLNAHDCHGWVIGEQGANSIAVWSGVHVAGVRLQSLNPAIGTAADPEKWSGCHQMVVQCANEIAKIKRSPSMAISMSLASLVKSILHNNREVFSVTTLVKGYHGIVDELFLSLPAVLGDAGVCDVIKQTLAPEESKKLQDSSAAMKALIASLKF